MGRSQPSLITVLFTDIVGSVYEFAIESWQDCTVDASTPRDEPSRG